MPDMMDRMMPTMVALWLVVLAAFVAIVILAYKLFAGGGSGPSSHDGLRILEERYARGEIDRDEYEERRRDILVGRR